MALSVTAAERTVPHNLEAERSTIGALLVNNDMWAQVAAIVGSTDFYREAHRRIFAAMERLHDSGSALDFVLLKNELDRAGDLEECGGPAYIGSLVDGMPRSTNGVHYARLVKTSARLREAIDIADRLLSRAYEQDEVDLVLDDGIRELLAVTEADASGIITLNDALARYMAAVDTDIGAPITTGLRDVDETIRGFARKCLTIIASRPSVGKTSLALCGAEAAAATGVPSAMITLEMSAEALVPNMLSASAHIDGDRLRRKLLGEKDWLRISHACSVLSERQIYFVETASTLTQIAAWVQQLKARGVGVVFIDYLQLLGNQEATNRSTELGLYSRGLKRLALEQDVAIVALSQLSRASERRTDKRPQLADLRESGALEQDADVVLLLYRDDMHNTDPNNEQAGIGEIIVAKNRHGPTGVARACFLKEQTRWCDLAMH